MFTKESKSYQDAIKLQKRLAQKVIIETRQQVFQKICTVDISYKNDVAFCSAIIYDKKQNKVIESKNCKIKSKTPYIPGLFMLKEAGPIFSVLKMLEKNYDIILVDGNGQIHPRFCGLACYIGIRCNTSTIGVAKSLHCGNIKGNEVWYEGRLVGNVIEKNKKRIYVSVGNKISLKNATKLVQELIPENGLYPEPLRIADHNSKQFKKVDQL